MKRIMIVDDNREIIQLVSGILGDHGYGVEAACCGEECLEKIGEFDPDMVLLDIMMPGMDGWEVLEELERADMALEGKIVLFSVKPLQEEDWRRKGYRQVARYIHKPVSTRELLEELEDIFRERTEAALVQGPGKQVA